MKPRKSLLDSELAELAVSPLESTRTLALSASRPMAAAERPMPRPPERTALKMIVAAGREREAAEWLHAHGGEVTSEGARVLLASMPTGQIFRLESCEFLERAEAPRQFFLRNDAARGAATRLEEALGEHPLSGDGVVVGIVDSGVDWRHADFRRDDPPHQTRLELFANFFLDGADNPHFEFFDQNQINQALQGGAGVPDGDAHGHGTHCASIAAGNGRASGGDFRGVATDAAVMAVAANPLLDDFIIRGVREIFARAGDRPAVVNLSLGGHIGAHDGTAAIETVIDEESGPGRIIVVAAGNEGSDLIHWQGQLTLGTTTEIPFRAIPNVVQTVDVWIPRDDEVDIEIETPEGVRHVPTGDIESTSSGDFIADFREDQVNRDGNLTVRTFAFGDINGAAEIWRIRLTPIAVTHGTVHAWSQTRNGDRSLFPIGGDDQCSIGMPATSDRGIAVASYVSKNQFQGPAGVLAAQGLTPGGISPFSSAGPTRIGELKPDIAAPGQFITAAMAANSVLATDVRYADRRHPNGQYVTIQGTSMATPFVVGLIALLLEREPDLTPEDIVRRLRATARRDPDTGPVWGSRFGFGKTDALELLRYGH